MPLLRSSSAARNILALLALRQAVAHPYEQSGLAIIGNERGPIRQPLCWLEGAVAFSEFACRPVDGRWARITLTLLGCSRHRGGVALSLAPSLSVLSGPCWAVTFQRFAPSEDFYPSVERVAARVRPEVTSLLMFARPMILRGEAHPGNSGFRWEPSVHWPCKAQ